MIYKNIYKSPLGNITLTSNGDTLTGLVFENQKYQGHVLLQNSETKELPVFEETKLWLGIYFQGKEPDFMPKISLENTTSFRKEVAEIMLTIPYGQTMTYGEIADILAKRRGVAKMSARAVGGAVGHNPISIIVPCHRVVGANGNLTGYAGGMERKIELLKLEQVDLSKYFKL